MSESTPVIAVQGLTKHYGGVKALTDAEFRLNPGEHVAIVGDNGAGKSTFVRLITGVEQPSRGDILMDGQPVAFDSPLDAREQGVETVFQNLALAEDLDVPANIFMGREITRLNLGPLSILNHRAMRAQSVEMLSTTGVKIQDLSEPMRGMSGGQRQCVAIARAAGFAKKLIILDEPTAALGVQETARVEEIIRGLKARGVPLIIISHNLRQVFDLVDRIYVFRQGRIICSRLKSETTPEEIVGLITGAIDPASLPQAEATTC
ncbi:ATP-binding cassette domain-containing protein [Betaproteobacteria bacterium LSUCC0117]|jgi:ABC-type sugar transport system ATPase subunit|nr:ATP-binding cassette domain-containing protein [Betaproteobacteria bacterium LSUCC0117]MDP4671563.1 ATP-binding cassette domain-containing protein [Burkholderiaceae bacterium]MDP4863768.1 ATP-binding cassette domain-containing protein [Burkholderiaceae bacterium]